MKARLLVVFVVISLLSVGFSFPREAQASTNTFCHYVKRGETVSQIAASYGVTVAAIQQANNLWNPSLIYVGQCLLIPSAGSAPPSQCVQVHIVRSGEYLKSIAAQYGVTVTAIVNANGLSNPNLIYTGQRLMIPCTSAPPPAPPQPPSTCYKTHVVQRGEYVKSIALKYGVSYTSIVQANGLSNPNLIYPGQRLKIPVRCDKPKPTPTPKPGDTPWTAKYWSNRLLSGDPTFTRKETAVDFNWGTNGPGGKVKGTDFSTRFTRSRHFDGGKYRFYVTVDDGVRVWIDGVLIIDQWHDSSPRTYSAERLVTYGAHELKIDYYQNQGGAQIKFWIEYIGGTPPDQTGVWKGEFFNNVKLEGTPAATHYYNAIDFDLGNKSPASGVTADYFSARFGGEFTFEGAKYRFKGTVDDGIRVWLDDQLIIDQWNVGSTRTYLVEKDLSAGKHKLRVEYFENNGDAVCKFKWTKL